MCSSLSVKILPFSCNFQQKFCEIIGWCTHLWSWSCSPGNFGSNTALVTVLSAELFLALTGTIPVEQKKCLEPLADNPAAVTYRTIHEAATLMAPGQSMALTGTIPVEPKNVHCL